MQVTELKRIEELDFFYWWFVARHELATLLLKGYLSDRDNLVLDIGCGTGVFLKELSKLKDMQIYGLDISSYAIESSLKKGFNKLYLENATKTHFVDHYFDFITGLDIFEHIEDDTKAFSECFRILKDKGRMLLTVPAFGFLWSEHDVAFGHKRRYKIPDLKKKLALAGFKIEKITYCMFFVFLPISILRICQNYLVKSDIPHATLPTLPKCINYFLLSLLRIENLLIRAGFNFPFGVSIVCIAGKG